jgi:hypothetical protein
MAMNLSKDGNVVRRSLPLLRAGPPGPLVRDDDDTVEGYSPSFTTITDELQNRNSTSEVSCVGVVVGSGSNRPRPNDPELTGLPPN